MDKVRQCLDFSPKPVAGFAVVQETRLEDLDGHDAIHHGVYRSIDLAEAALAHFIQDAVLTQEEFIQPALHDLCQLISRRPTPGNDFFCHDFWPRSKASVDEKLSQSAVLKQAASLQVSKEGWNVHGHLQGFYLSRICWVVITPVAQDSGALPTRRDARLECRGVELDIDIDLSDSLNRHGTGDIRAPEKESSHAQAIGKV